LEEARADLFALYYMMDEKMVEIGLMPNLEVAKAEYETYIRNGLLTQLTRIELGKDIEESHMRNRQLIAKWVFEKGASQKIIERKQKDEKTYFVVNDYLKLRNLFGELLAEVQRIKSEGDFEAGKAMVENYGVKVDEEIHKEVLVRFQKLNLAAYAGFINPDYEPAFKDGKIVDVKITYPMDFAEQMLLYSEKYSFLPNIN
jgi:dipeptidyl-peptidase-3